MAVYFISKYDETECRISGTLQSWRKVCTPAFSAIHIVQTLFNVAHPARAISFIQNQMQLSHETNMIPR